MVRAKMRSKMRSTLVRVEQICKVELGTSVRQDVDFVGSGI
jgi:hypothetical protein